MRTDYELTVRRSGNSTAGVSGAAMGLVHMPTSGAGKRSTAKVATWLVGLFAALLIAAQPAFALDLTPPSNIRIGSTRIVSGTNTRVLFDKDGVVGEDAGFTYVEGTDVATLVGGVRVGSAGNIGWTDLLLERDGANALGLRNGTNIQSFGVYKTFTDAANQAKADIIWSGNTALFRAIGIGTGGNPGALFGTDGSGNAGFMTTGVSRWEIGGTTGHFLAVTDNTFDIGASAANRPRSIWLGQRMSQNVQAAALGNPGTNEVSYYTREDLDQGSGTVTADCALVARLPSGSEILIQVLVSDGGC